MIHASYPNAATNVKRKKGGKPLNNFNPNQNSDSTQVQMLDGALQHVLGSLKKTEYLREVGDIQKVADVKVSDIHRFVDRYHREVQVPRVGVLHHKVFGHHRKDLVFGQRVVWMHDPELLHQGVQVYAHRRTGSFLRPYWLHSVTRVDVYACNA